VQDSLDTPATSGLAAMLALAVIQGISEFLPISSDGHLVLAQAWMGFEGPRLAFDVALHFGTLLAVVVVFRRDLLTLTAQVLSGDRRELWLLLIASVPAAIVGLGMKSWIEPLFHSARAAAIGLLVTACFLAVGERARRRMPPDPSPPGGAPLTWGSALLIGSAQALAILPGVSRSGSTIATALLLGVETAAAARVSFLLSVPAVAGAVLLEVPSLAGESLPLGQVALAVAAAFAVGVVALRVLLAFLGRGAFRWCAIYTAVLGALALALLSASAPAA
jgi:undecaprenyl-diphosphatase